MNQIPKLSSDHLKTPNIYLKKYSFNSNKNWSEYWFFSNTEFTLNEQKFTHIFWVLREILRLASLEKLPLKEYINK